MRMLPATSITVILGLTILQLSVVSCTEERIPNSLPPTHPAEWMDASSADFHGAITLTRGTGSCVMCHGEDLDGGKIDVSCTACHLESGACASCHGGLDNTTGAPPYGLSGESSDTALAVGAHTIHLEGSALAGPIACATCHVVPATILEPSHLDLDTLGMPTVVDSIAELTFSGLAATDSALTVWDRSSRTCSQSYCHGNFPGGDRSNAPVWTSGSAPCGSCHDAGDDPASLGWKHEYHVTIAELSCSECHANVVDPNNLFIGVDLHVNGVADTMTADTAVCNVCHAGGAGGCTLCHGGNDNETGAPPRGLEGETQTTQLAVGAHTAHIEGGSIANAIPCNTCHTVPTAAGDPGHMDGDGIAELTWGGLAGPGAAWNRAAATCQSTYCHGNFAGGDNSNLPVWTSGSAPCGSCHDDGTNPSELGWKHDVHVRIFTVPCSECHAQVINFTGDIIGPSFHVNGQVDTATVTATCDFCHGDSQPACDGCHGGIDNSTGAPPRGLEGEMQTNQMAVGAHTAHIEGGAVSDGVLCSDCHLVPQYFGDPGHFDVDSVAELTFSSLAGSSAAWDRGTATCANSYCHGEFSGGNGNNQPVWTNAATGTCGTCHDDGTNPSLLSGRHRLHIQDESIACYRCHDGVMNTSDQIDGFSLHVNGVKNVQFSNGGTYSNGDCVSTGCHGRESW